MLIVLKSQVLCIWENQEVSEIQGADVDVSGRRGVFTGASGLQIAYVSGQEALQEPAPAHCFTSKDLSALVLPLTSSSKFRGVDILLTSEWPRGVWQYGNNPVKTHTLYSYNVWPLLLSSLVSVAGSEYKVLWKQRHRQPCWESETAVPLCSTRGRSLWATPIQVSCRWDGVRWCCLLYANSTVHVCVLRNHIVLSEKAQHVSRFIALATVNNPAKKKVTSESGTDKSWFCLWRRFLKN